MIKPTLGYPTRTAAVEAMLADGLSRREIASEIGGTENSIQMLIYLAKRRQADRKIVLSRPMIEVLRGEAARRGTKPAALAHHLLETIVSDDLFDALLGEPEPRCG
jgi:hypothetical protein